MDELKENWWGRLELEDGGVHHLRVGNCALSIQKIKTEWRVSHKYLAEKKEQIEDTKEFSNDMPTQFKRFGFDKAPDCLYISPQLPDKPLIAKPLLTLSVPQNESMIYYVATPVWIRIEAGERRRFLDCIPSVRLSQTWFGPNTILGDVCYASRSRCRTHLKDIKYTNELAITKVTLVNKANHPHVIDQVNIPLPYLSLYSNDNGWLWTNSMRILQEENKEQTDVHILGGAPDTGGTFQSLVSPRQILKSGKVQHKYRIFHKKEG